MEIRSMLLSIAKKVLSLSMIFAIGFAVGTQMGLKYPSNPWALWSGIAVALCACGKMFVAGKPALATNKDGSQPKKP